MPGFIDDRLNDIIMFVTGLCAARGVGEESAGAGKEVGEGGAGNVGGTGGDAGDPLAMCIEVTVEDVVSDVVGVDLVEAVAEGGVGVVGVVEVEDVDGKGGCVDNSGEDFGVGWRKLR